MLWSFWIACGLAVTGAILPLLLTAGGTNRVAGAAIPFGVAALAFAAAALLYTQGRPLATGLYLIAGLALVYGILYMIAVPVRLAVLGTCDPAPAICAAGFEPPMSAGESSGLAIGVATGTLAILVGDFGLLMLRRLRPGIATGPSTRIATAPPTRIAKPWIPPAMEAPTPGVAGPEPSPGVVAAPAAETPVVTAGDSAAAASKPARKPRAKRSPKPQAELAAPVEPLELAAPEAPLELPAPEAKADPDPAG